MTRGVVTFADASAYFEDYSASGIQTDMHLFAQGERMEATFEPLRIARLDAGIPVTAMNADVFYAARAQAASVRLQALSASVLGGQASIDQAEIDLADISGAFSVALTELSLAEVLALEGEDVTGSGELYGRLPVQLSAGAVAIAGGRIQARPPGGKIRVGEDFTAPTGQPGLDFAVRALADFAYSELDAAVDYAEDGELLLAIKLRGRNPEVENGRAIHYNLNVTENVPSLLESLQADMRLTERIQNKVERKVN